MRQLANRSSKTGLYQHFARSNLAQSTRKGSVHSHKVFGFKESSMGQSAKTAVPNSALPKSHLQLRASC